MTKICPICKKEFKCNRSSRKICGRKCLSEYISSIDRGTKGKPKPIGFGDKISAALSGKERPWARGSRNPNYKNAAQNKHREKFLEGIKNRKLNPEIQLVKNKLHSSRMKGKSNWMRGKKHSQKTRQLISEKAKERYKRNGIRYKLNISKAEKYISDYLDKKGIKHIHQYCIPGISFVYDIYIPELKLIIEYNGNFWHMNPLFYNATDRRSKNETICAQEIWDRDKVKKRLALENGYLFETIWESDHKRSLDALSKIVAKILRKYRRKYEKDF